MQGSVKIPLELYYESGESKFSELDFYYGTDSMGGAAEAIAIATHAIIHDEVVTQTPSVKGFGLNFKNSSPGSFRQKFEIEFTDAMAVSALTTMGIPAFIETLTLLLGIPMGGTTKSERRKTMKWLNNMDDLDKLLDRLYRPLVRIHHPVSGQGYKVTLKKAQTKMVIFDSLSHKYMTEDIKDPKEKTITVAVSRFNGRRCTGRFIDRHDAESISFSPKVVKGQPQITKKEMNFLASSLTGVVNDLFLPVQADVTEIRSYDGRVKHYILHRVYEKV
ncbi:hypothetical protein ACFPTX_05640 [Pseudomonas sp. GCM10022188]|uniref:hypothetical protein n=1 Tax=Pseudomonas TaxID=286 RepID=UPI001E41CB51|nr:hypothetical protein [Pseudomonas oryzagri]MCC6077166.1 hypothetical protein [Pseudomonas oryzagri]